MKRNIIFILTMTILGILYPVLSNLRTEATEAIISDTETTIVAEAEEKAKEEPFYDIDKVNPETSVDDANNFATITAEETPIEEPKSKPVVEPVKTEPVSVAPASTPKPTYVAPTPAPKPEPTPAPAPKAVQPATQPDHIEVAGKWVNVYNVDSTALDAGNSVYRFVNTAKGYDGRFLYGHNSNNVFGGLKNLSVGSTFTLTLNNTTVTYRVSNIVIFEKNQNTGKLTLNGEGSYMTSVARAKHNGSQYDLSLMTCHGTSLGHGDATHRLVIFANRI